MAGEPTNKATSITLSVSKKPYVANALEAVKKRTSIQRQFDVEAAAREFVALPSDDAKQPGWPDKFGRANSRYSFPPGARQQFGCAFHAPPRLSAAVAGADVRPHRAPLERMSAKKRFSKAAQEVLALANQESKRLEGNALETIAARVEGSVGFDRTVS